MMIAVAITGIEFGLITAVATSMEPSPAANDWLVSTGIVGGLHLLSLSLFVLAHIYIDNSHIIKVISYKGPVTYKGRLLRKNNG
jgi:hypothetical protein